MQTMKWTNQNLNQIYVISAKQREMHVTETIGFCCVSNKQIMFDNQMETTLLPFCYLCMFPVVEKPPLQSIEVESFLVYE